MTTWSDLIAFVTDIVRTECIIFFGLMLLYVHRDHKDYYGQGAQDGHLDFHGTAAPAEPF